MKAFNDSLQAGFESKKMSSSRERFAFNHSGLHNWKKHGKSRSGT